MVPNPWKNHGEGGRWGFSSRYTVLSPCVGPSADPGWLWEGARLVEGLVVLVETSLAGLVLVTQMASLGGSGARAHVGSFHFTWL